MDIDRRSGAPSAFTWLLGVTLGATCAATTPACSASSASAPSGWAQSGGGPLGAAPSSGGGGEDATTDAVTAGEGDAAPVPAGDGGAVDDAAGDGGSGAEDGGDGATGPDAAGDAIADAGPGDAAGDGGNGADFTLLDTTITNVVQGSPVPGFDPIPAGATIDLAKVGSALSVRANTVPAAVGSVAFALDATYTHTENTAPYTLCSDDGAGVVTSCASVLTPGAHTLKATPYSAADLGGTAGTPFMVTFTLVAGDAGATDAAAKDATDQ